MTGGGGKSAFRKALHFPLNVVSRLSPCIGGILSTFRSFVYAIALKIDFGFSISRKSFQCFFLASLIALA